MKKSLLAVFCLSILTLLSLTVLVGTPASAQAINTTPSFTELFGLAGKLTEAAASSLSTSPNWWLASGGYILVENGIGKTIQGSLPATNPISQSYAAKYPIQSDNGTHPQNLFRFITKSSWDNFEQEVSVKITRTNLSNTANRYPYNAIALISRYKDDNNYYHAALRMDGKAVIKKKINGTYTTLGQKQFFPGTYNASTNPNLLPADSPFGIRMGTVTNSDGNVMITLYADKTNSGSWTKIIEITDTANVVSSAGKSGIWTDFMDVEFDNYKIVKYSDSVPVPAPEPAPTPIPEPVPTPVPVPTTDYYGLSTDVILQEVGSMGSSPNPNWWLNSGAYFTIANGVGKTVFGNLPTTDTWRLAYAASNARDTDNGYHPQNLFRLLSKTKWRNVSQEAYFTINAYNQSTSPERDAWNGILFFNRYKDNNNLYYAGIRVDGRAIIKKKLNGVYYTMAEVPAYSGIFNRTTNPTLLPFNKPLGLKTVTTDLADGSVSIKVFLDKNNIGAWTQVASAIDNGTKYGSPIRDSAYAGIRTDFMDIGFTKYKVFEL